MARVNLSVSPRSATLTPIYQRQTWETQTGKRYVNDLSGSRWQLSMTFRLGEDERRALVADIASLLSHDDYWGLRIESVLGIKNASTIPSNVIMTIPSLSFGDSAVLTIGGNPTSAQYIERGDYITINDELKVSLGRTGNGGTLRWWPRLRNAPAAAQFVYVNNPRADFVLADQPSPILYRPVRDGSYIETTVNLVERTK